MVQCQFCSSAATIKRPKSGEVLCKDCFYHCFEEEIHQTVTKAHLFKRGEKIALGASGGKDSTVLAHVLR